MEKIPSYVLIDKFDPFLLENLSNKYEGIYASINNDFLMKINKPDINEVLFLDETIIDDEPFNLVSFYFCQIKKLGKYTLKERALSKNLVLSEDVMTSGDYYEKNGKFDGIKEMLDGDEDVVLVVSSVINDNGDRLKFVRELYENEHPIEKPKTLKLIN